MTIQAPLNPAFGCGFVADIAGATTINLRAATEQVQFFNHGPDVAYVRMAPNFEIAASNHDAILPVGMPIVYSKFQDITTIGFVSEGDSKIHVMPGQGYNGF